MINLFRINVINYSNYNIISMFVLEIIANSLLVEYKMEGIVGPEIGTGSERFE